MTHMTLQELQKRTMDMLSQAGIADAGRETRWLLKHALGVSDADLISGGASPSSDAVASVQVIAGRRAAGEPVSRIIGEKEFDGLSYKVTPDVLDPRMDTETLVAAVVARFKDRQPQRILDLGTGSGCILISLLKAFPESIGVGVDVSRDALAVAQENATRHGVAARASFVQGDWASPVLSSLRKQGSDVCSQPDSRFRGNDKYFFDLIVSNPPYIPSGDIPNLDKEVKNYDPILALDGGFDGLQAYKKIFSQIKALFSQGGCGFFEVGILQAQDVARLAENAGFLVRGYHTDSAGILRVLEIDSGEK